MAKATEGYCGADIEEVVKNTVENIFILETENEEEKEITTQDLLESAKNIDSLTNILADKIEILKTSYDKFKIKSASQKNKKYGKTKFKDMVIINGGKYKPSFSDEEKEVYTLEVCKYLVTQDMWIEIMGNNPSYFKGGKRPVESVSWWEALEYCNKLSEKYKLKPVYDLSRKEKNILKINQLDEDSKYPSTADFRKTEGFRLPTELEWEWFAKGGEVAIQDGTFNFKYSGSKNIDEVAWYRDNSGNQTHNVGMKKTNQLGIYDCSGNVWEWCYDGNDSGFWEESDSKGMLYFYKSQKDGFGKIVRGGSFGEEVEVNEFYLRDFLLRDHRTRTYGYEYYGEYNSANYYNSYINVGFRIVRTI